MHYYEKNFLRYKKKYVLKPPKHVSTITKKIICLRLYDWTDFNKISYLSSVFSIQDLFEIYYWIIDNNGYIL